MLMIKEYWNLIGWEPFLSLTWELDFSQACSFRRMLMNHKNFDFTQIPDKTNIVIFLKSHKTMFLGHFWQFSPNGDFFPKKPALPHTTINGTLTYAKFQKLISKSQENVRADERRNRQTLFYRTLPAETRDTTTSLQQVTGGNTPNLVLKRMLRYFLKIPPLKRILQF